jgi:hypothetical protein
MNSPASGLFPAFPWIRLIYQTHSQFAYFSPIFKKICHYEMVFFHDYRHTSLSSLKRIAFNVSEKMDLNKKVY